MAESPERMYAIATIMTVLALLAVGLRFWARHVKKSGLSWDDYMILPALVCFPIVSLVQARSLILAIAVHDRYSYLHVHW